MIFASLLLAHRSLTVLPDATAADVLNWHRCDRDWLHREITLIESIRCPVLVISHHLPTSSLVHSKYITFPLNAAFASECSERGWIAGHTHTAVRYTSGRMRLGVKLRGYPDETDSGFRIFA